MNEEAPAVIDPVSHFAPRPHQVQVWQQNQSIEEVFTDQMNDLQAARKALIDQMNGGNYKAGPDTVEALIALMREERALIGAIVAGAEGETRAGGSGINPPGGPQFTIVAGNSVAGPVAGARVLPNTYPISANPQK